MSIDGGLQSYDRPLGAQGFADLLRDSEEAIVGEMAPAYSL
jgi:hypothetical protein